MSQPAWTPENAAQALVQFSLEIGSLELLPDGRTLKSGRVSPYFFNSGLFCDGSALEFLGPSYAEVIAKSAIPYDVVFGPAYKGIPLAVTTAIYLAKSGLASDYAFNRKEAKGHGEGGLLVGASLAGKRVIIVDDVISDGASKREAKEIIEAAGGTVVAVVIAFDRQERGLGELSALKEFEQTFETPVLAAATLTDLIVALEATASVYPERGGILPGIYAYRDEFGA
jgi:orotate phosphoribosyltransferase